MPNTQTTVNLFVAGAVLTAAQLNQSAATGIPVFATTVTRDAAFGGANKALAEGQFAYIEAGNLTQYYDGAAWVTVGASGLVYLTGGAFTTVSAVNLAANTFSATYRNYLLNINITANGADSNPLNWRGRVAGADDSAANYNYGLRGVRYSDGAATTGGNATSATAGRLAYMPNPVTSISVTAYIFAPQLASPTTITTKSTGRGVGDGDSALEGGSYFSAATQFDALSFYPASSTISGTYGVFGYAIS